MKQPIGISIMLLAVAGLGSALLTVSGILKGDVAGFLGIGFLFGGALAVYFVVCENYRRPAKIAGFICACTAAFPASVLSIFPLMAEFPTQDTMSSPKIDFPAPEYFGAGCVGAFVVLAAGVFSFGRRNLNWTSTRRILLLTIGGGLLGVAGGRAGSARTNGTYHDMVLLFLIWQPGAAMLLGALLKWEMEPRAAPSMSATLVSAAPKIPANRDIGIVGRVFFACVLGFLGFLIIRSVQANRFRARQDAARKLSVAEAPSVVNLPRIEPLLPEQALIVKEIAGWYPISVMSNAYRPFGQVPAENYVADYSPTKEQPAGSVYGVVEVIVTQLPNAEWARYRVNHPQTGADIQSPKSLTNVRKFGQTIVQDTSARDLGDRATLCFLWPSGSFVVSVCYQTPKVNEDFLEKYLEKYPSSL
jgi:hypothetical protein